MIQLLDGPCRQWTVPSSYFRGGRATIRLATTPPPPLTISHGAPEPLRFQQRQATYRMVNDEDGTARFEGWEDELVAAAANGPIAKAMAAATDDELRALLDAMAKAPARPR